MTRKADVTVYSADGKLQLVVEVKKRAGASLEWVTQMRRNLLLHALIPHTPYFLLALPDYFYFWKNTDTANNQALPAYQIETLELLSPYLKQSDLSLDEVSEYGFQFLVTAWLEDFINSDLTKELVNPALHPLFDSGLYQALKNGSVAVEAVV